MIEGPWHLGRHRQRDEDETVLLQRSVGAAEVIPLKVAEMTSLSIDAIDAWLDGFITGTGNGLWRCLQSMNHRSEPPQARHLELYELLRRSAVTKDDTLLSEGRDINTVPLHILPFNKPHGRFSIHASAIIAQSID